jgi:hypothetical protein
MFWKSVSFSWLLSLFLYFLAAMRGGAALMFHLITHSEVTID